MSPKKITLKYKKERAVLSDVLPYEVPVTFSNRHYYHFLLENKIHIDNGNITWLANDAALDRIICLLFALEFKPEKIKDCKKFVGEEQRVFRYYEQPTQQQSIATIPFGYKINHKNDEFRELSVPHPRAQIEVVDFYDSTKELIIYNSSRSPFAIRRPASIARYKFHKDRIHYESLAEGEATIEEQGREYESIRSFFVYKNYSNVFKFYESYKYHRCEKKYDKLLKLDISKCFDSIYTHSLPWAIWGKEAVKQNLGPDKIKDTFSGRFDKLMQRINYNETNGIIIGPEFSRIFAEILLQGADVKLLKILKDNHKLRHREHYEIFRYVDDYFVFFNDDLHKEVIVRELQHVLRIYKLHLNAAKSIVYEKPLITEITVAKQKIARLLDDKLQYKLEKVEKEGGEEVVKGEIYLNSKSLITQFKAILAQSNVTYKDILNYTLSTVENKSEKILKNYNKTTAELRSEKQITRAILSVLEFVFFIYSVSPKVNTTIKLCRLIRLFNTFLGARSISYSSRQAVVECIYENASMILKKNKGCGNVQVETLYLLTVLSELGREYWLAEDVLATYLNLRTHEQTGEYVNGESLNYFSLTVSLFYMRNKKRYGKLRKYIEAMILHKFNAASPKSLLIDTELTLLLFDVISCPYVSLDTKRMILNKYGVVKTPEQDQVIGFKNRSQQNQLWFTTWEKFDFGKELDSKQSQEVY